MSDAPLTALSFVAPPPGLDPHTRFSLTAIDGATGLFALHPADDAALRMFVLDAAVYLPDYSPTLSDEQCEAIGVSQPEQVLLLTVATTAETGTTVNLMAPIVANRETGAAAQVILENQKWPLRHSLTAAA